ncbi:MAG: hypothetical protein MI919_15665 [Holophagales bacterium]|nr:hypothetical protein [Holophagales bacterium]
MSLNDEQRVLYENILSTSRNQISELDQQIEVELAKVKDRLAELQNKKKAARNMYDAACQMLGVANELEDEDEDED